MLIDQFIAWLVSPRPGRRVRYTLDGLWRWLRRVKAQFVAPAPPDVNDLSVEHPEFIRAYVRNHHPEGDSAMAKKTGY